MLFHFHKNVITKKYKIGINYHNILIIIYGKTTWVILSIAKHIEIGQKF